MATTLALPTEKAVKIALRTQQIIAEETEVPHVIDPLAGSYFVEAQTNRLEQEAERYFGEIDRRGGVVPCIQSGYIQREIHRSALEYQLAVERGEKKVVGVNAYVDEAEKTPIPVLEVPEGSLERHLDRLSRTRRERDAAAVDAALAGLRDAARRPGSTDTNLMPHFIRCAEAYATLGEQCAVLREVFGEYREPAAV